ncbi:hypothetical protein ACGF0D_19045 [Kitasatospora sp. NPDC048298]|uniref:hypothetical protein n=1 Tax=Kitasatospora sp. NPDC048298 TaxID=3364049 RepID=UPI00371DEE41
MPLSVKSLTETLAAAAKKGSLLMQPEYLQLAPAADLFKSHLKDGALQLDPVRVDGLTVAGPLSLSGGSTAPSTVRFLTDSAGATVVGVRIDAALPGAGTELPKEVRRGLVPLERFGLGTLHLVLGVEPGVNRTQQALVGAGAELDFPTAQAHPKPYVWGYPPAKGNIWLLQAAFDPVAITGLDSLRAFASLAQGGFDLPSDLAPGAGLALTALAIGCVVDGGTSGGGGKDRILAIQPTVILGREWTPVEGVTVKGLRADLSVLDPFSHPQLLTTLGGRVEFPGSVAVEVEVGLPERSLKGVLAEPVNLGKLVAERFSGIPVPKTLTVSELELWAELAAGANNRGYGLDLALTEVWKVTDGVELAAVVLTVSHQVGLKYAGVTAEWRLGTGVLDVTGTWSSATGWAFAAHAVGLQPADLLKHLGITAPEQLRSLTVEELAVAFDTQGHFTFACATSVAVGNSTLSVVVSVIADRTKGSTVVTGEMRLAVPLADGTEHLLTFTVDYGKDPTGRVLTARWKGTPGITVRELADALELDLLEEVPQEVLPTLTSLGLRYDTLSKQLLVLAETKSASVAFASLPG